MASHHGETTFLYFILGVRPNLGQSLILLKTRFATTGLSRIDQCLPGDKTRRPGVNFSYKFPQCSRLLRWHTIIPALLILFRGITFVSDVMNLNRYANAVEWQEIAFIKQSVVLGTLVLVASEISLHLTPVWLICGERYMITYAHLIKRWVAWLIDITTHSITIQGRTCLAIPPIFWNIFIRPQPVPPFH